MDLLPVELDIISEKGEYSNLIKQFYLNSYSNTRENGIKYILSELDDELIVEELRFPYQVNISDQKNKIHKLFNDHNIFNKLKNIRQNIIVSKAKKNIDYLKKCIRQWTSLYSIYQSLTSLLKLYSEKKTDTLLNHLEYCYYLNELVIKKYKYIPHDPLDLVEEFNCVDQEVNQLSRDQYFKLLVNQNQYYSNFFSDQDVTIGSVVVNNEDGIYGIVKKHMGNNSFLVYYPTLKVEREIEDSEFKNLKSNGNRIFNLINDVTIPLRDYIGTSQDTFSFYNNLINNFIRYYDNSSIKIDFKKLENDVYSIVFLDISPGYYLKSNNEEFIGDDYGLNGGNFLNYGGAKSRDINRTKDQYYLSIDNTSANVKDLKKLGLKKNEIKQVLEDDNKWIITESENDPSKYTATYNKEPFYKFQDIVSRKIVVPDVSNLVRLGSRISSDDQPILSSTQPTSLDDQPISSTTQPTSLDDQPISSSTQPTSLDDQPISSDPKPKTKLKTKGKKSKKRVKTTSLNTNNHLKYALINNNDITKRPYKITYKINKQDYTPPLDDCIKNKTDQLIKISTKTKQPINLGILNLKPSLLLKTIKLRNNPSDLLTPNFNTIKDELWDIANEDTKKIIIGYTDKPYSETRLDNDLLKLINDTNYSYYTYNFNFTLGGYLVPNVEIGLDAFLYFDPSNKYITKNVLNGEILDFKYPIKSSDEFKKIYPTPRDKIYESLGLNGEIVLDNIGRLNIENFNLKRLLYSQFISNSILEELLVETGDYFLIGYNQQENYFYPLFSLMEIRYYLLNKDKSPYFYNIDREDELQRETDIRDKIINFLLEYDVTTLELNPESEIYDKFQDIADTQLLNSIIIDINQDDEFIQKRFNLQINLEKEKSKNDLKIKNIETSLIYGRSLRTKIGYDTDELLPSGINLKLLNDLEPILNIYNLTYQDLGNSGNNLFYSIIDQLIQHDILPNNYSRVKTEINNYYVYDEAASQLRKEIALKIQQNLTSENDKVIYEVLDQQDNFDVKSTNLNLKDTISLLSQFNNIEGTDLVDNYIAKLTESCTHESLDNSSLNGIWGGDLELHIVSAIFNCNIINFNYYPNNNQNPIYINHIYSSDKKQIYPLGLKYNIDTPIKTIFLNKIGYQSANKDVIPYWISCTKNSNLLEYYYDKQNNLVIKREYHDKEKNITLNNYTVGYDFNIDSGFFTLGLNESEFQHDINIDNCEIIRYFKDNKNIVSYEGKIVKDEKNKVSYRGKIIGDIKYNLFGIKFN